MKKLVLVFCALMISTSAAFALDEKGLMGKTVTDVKFMQDVENSIKNLFKEPHKVTLKFSAMGVEFAKAPHFYAEVEYSVDTGNVDMGSCTFVVLGELKADSSVQFKKIVREDCGS